MIGAVMYIVCNGKKFFMGDDVTVVLKTGEKITGTIKNIHSDAFFADSEVIFYSDVREIKKYKAK